MHLPRAASLLLILVAAAISVPGCSLGVDDDLSGGRRASGPGANGAGGPASSGAAPGDTPTKDRAAPGVEQVGRPGGPGCGLPSAALCETFDAPAGIGDRAGQLNGVLWGASRGGPVNLGQSTANAWMNSVQDQCGRQVNVDLFTDISICNGRMVESSNDGGSVTALAIYAKQPFDIAGRTGTIAFDVTNNTHGNHAAWPEIWYTDKPVPTPFAHFDSWRALPQEGMGIRFAGYCKPNQACGLCPGVSSKPRMGVNSAIVINNYVANDSEWSDGNLRVQSVDCVEAPTGPNGGLNHVEIRVAKDLMEVYATDAGTLAPLKKIAVINNPNLTLTRGFVWMQDVHYNGDKDGPDQRTNTFAWDNFGFDGPVLPRDLAFDAIGNDLRGSNAEGSFIADGWVVQANQTQTISIPKVTGINKANAGIITLNHFVYDAPVTLTYSLNGHPPHTFPWPYPNSAGYTWRTVALPIPLSEVVAGTNSLAISANVPIVLSNFDLILLGAGGLPGSAP